MVFHNSWGNDNGLIDFDKCDIECPTDKCKNCKIPMSWSNIVHKVAIHKYHDNNIIVIRSPVGKTKTFVSFF